MNNKRLGSIFEQEFCRWLADRGYWVHFISPSNTGSQPFDVIAVKDNKPIAFDCKTSARKIFSVDRLEENQKMAFRKWLECGNKEAYIAVKYLDALYMIPFEDVMKNERVRIDDYPILGGLEDVKR